LANIEKPSFVTIGGTDEAGYKGDLQYHDLVAEKNTWWTVDFRNVKYNGSSIAKSDVKNAIIDSGTSFIYLAKADYDQLKMKL
jgi:cathepsin D